MQLFKFLSNQLCAENSVIQCPPRYDRIRRESLFCLMSLRRESLRGKHTSPKHAYAYVREGSINGFVLIMWRRQSEQHHQSCCGCFLGIFDTENSIQQKVEKYLSPGVPFVFMIDRVKKKFFFLLSCKMRKRKFSILFWESESDASEEVFEALKPGLSPEEVKWLEKKCRPVRWKSVNV